MMKTRRAFFILLTLTFAVDAEIAQGAKPDPSDFPNVGFLEADHGVCTGTLVAPQWVLTAGHCVDERPVDTYRFTLHPNPESDAPPKFVKADRLLLHPEYHPTLETPGVDAALLHLESPLPVVELAELPFSEYTVSAKDTLLNVGYGENMDGTQGYRRVKDLKFTRYEPLPAKTSTISKGLIQIARGKDNELGCAGDSGSPLVLARGGKYFLMGVYSTSERNDRASFDDKGCEYKDTHGNYIATKSFLPWVQTTAGID